MTASTGWDQPPGTLAPDSGLAHWDEPEGAGIFSSVDDFQNARAEGDGAETAWAGVGLGLDALGFVADPFGSLVSAGVGYIIEHISFLREPLDALAGHPDQIENAANAWHALSLELTAVAEELRGPGAPAGGSAAAPPGWEGKAADGFRRTAADRARRIDAVAAEGDQLAKSMLTEAANIGALRSIIRDLIADAVGTWAGTLAVGALATPVTFGVSLAGAAGAVVLEAADLALKIADKIATLISHLGAAGRALADGVRRAAELVTDVGLYGHFLAGAADDVLTKTPTAQVVEFGKGHSSTNFEDPAAQPG
jgi:hypothetical protein